jgi:glycine/D-amino acid oxidase-like deaminating enzyme
VSAGPSPWLAAPEPCAPLEGEREVDVAVIGAGYAGLSSALALRREGLSVAVLEARHAGFGASGRNAGHVTPTIGKDLPSLLRFQGRERARELLALVDRGIARVEALIRDHAIECDYEPVGNVVAAVHERQHRGLEGAARAASDLGVKGELLDAPALERRGLPRAFTLGWLEPHGGVLDPGKYVLGLRRAARAAGAELFEGSPVLHLAQGPRCALRTPRGRVRARHVILATNAWTARLGRLRSAGTRLQVQLFRTEPLDARQRERAGWQGREGVYTAHESLESYRWTADGRIVGGAKIVRAGFGGRDLPDVDPGVAARLEAVFRARFPELRDVRVAEHWGGPILVGLDFLPWVGRGGRHRNVLHALAWAGHGIPLASAAGEMLADLLLERPGPGAVLWTRRPLPTPPEPLRWLAFRAIDGTLRGIDRRADRAARGRAASGTARIG